MCMEDIRLGREMGFRETRVQTVVSTTGLLIAANPKRTRLVISPGGASGLMIGSRDLQPSVTAGIYLDFRSPVHVLTIEKFGKWLIGDIFVNDMGAATLVTVIEYELARD